MSAVRVIVPDVDEAVTAWAAAGYQVAQRWGPPFAVLSRPGSPDLWVAGPGTSAARTLEGLSAEDAATAAVRPVVEVDDVDDTALTLTTAGWSVVGDPVTGPGGSQQLVRRGPVFLEVFAEA